MVENVLRELCIEQLSNVHGPTWYKTQLSPTARDKFQAGLEYERSYFSLSYINFHPAYYLDFSDLRETIIRRDNWRTTFSAIFGARYAELINSTMSQIEPIRNKVAHNRTVLKHELATLEKFLGDIQNCLGPEKFGTLASRINNHQKIFCIFQKLGIEIQEITAHIVSYEVCSPSENWRTWSSQWWWDPTYLGQEVQAIDCYYTLIQEYKSLARGRGAGPTIEAWVAGHPVLDTSRAATDACRALGKLSNRESIEDPNR